MATVEEIRRWLRGDEVEGLPSRRKLDPSFAAGQGFDLGDGPYPGQDSSEPCEMCGLLPWEGEVKWRCARTAFPWDGKGANPNRCISLCDECSKKYDKEMDAMWNEYFAGRL